MPHADARRAPTSRDSFNLHKMLFLPQGVILWGMKTTTIFF